jgi:hypothetical protein
MRDGELERFGDSFEGVSTLRGPRPCSESAGGDCKCHGRRRPRSGARSRACGARRAFHQLSISGAAMRERRFHSQL